MNSKVRAIFESEVFPSFPGIEHGLRTKENGEYLSDTLEDHWNTFQEGFEFGVKKALDELGEQMNKAGDDQSNNPRWYKAIEKTKHYFGVK